MEIPLSRWKACCFTAGIMSAHSSTSSRKTALLALGALGVVFGDIGTSPLYALRECLSGPHGIGASPADVLGILSLIIWSLVGLISIKYVGLVMRADNHGEGGILALLAFGFPVQAKSGLARSRVTVSLLVLGLLGAALLYGDGIITPAISVLSAVEGLEVISPHLHAWVIPITVVILFLLFAFQNRGTGKVGNIFGPITLVWFLALAILGVRGIMMNPSVLHAINPLHAMRFLFEHRMHSAGVLGSVFLAVTGGEALYADMGHFGRKPIRLAWFWLVFPALVLNYLGQGALVLVDPDAAAQPFHRLAPAWASLPLVILGAMATVIASQALISGAFSLTMQAVQLGFLPRMSILHTSEREHGQIYIPLINRMLMVGCIALVLGFQTSSNLAAAYGIAVSLTMLITTILFYFITRRRWSWRAWKAKTICTAFLIIEGAFVLANMSKIGQGGWFPLVVGAMILSTMLTWKRGRAILAQKFATMKLPTAELMESLRHRMPARVRGTAVFLAASRGLAPGSLLHNLKHNQVLHQRVIIATVEAQRIPRVKPDDAVEVTDLGDGIWQVVICHGFMEQPDVPRALRACARFGLEVDTDHASYFLGRETIVATRANLPRWRAVFFAFLSRNSQSAMEFFKLPPNRVVELGTQIEI